MQYFDYLNIRGIYAVSGKEALACIESETIDLVLLDLHMPEQDGFQVIEKIRAGGSINAQVPIIAMTAENLRTRNPGVCGKHATGIAGARLDSTGQGCPLGKRYFQIIPDQSGSKCRGGSGESLLCQGLGSDRTLGS